MPLTIGTRYRVRLKPPGGRKDYEFVGTFVGQDAVGDLVFELPNYKTTVEPRHLLGEPEPTDDPVAPPTRT